jgi:hypothetical protein
MKAKATELKISKICNECVNYNNVREVHTFLGNGELCRGIAGGNCDLHPEFDINPLLHYCDDHESGTTIN